jgi:erythromycin esterase-like protein
MTRPKYWRLPRPVSIAIAILSCGVLGCVGLFGGTGDSSEPGVPGLRRFPFREPYRPGDCEFLKSVLNHRSLVQLGESIHVTRKFPPARLALVRYLREELSFDVRAFEGSVIDAWLAEDLIYQGRGSDQQKARRASMIACQETRDRFNATNALALRNEE